MINCSSDGNPKDCKSLSVPYVRTLIEISSAKCSVRITLAVPIVSVAPVFLPAIREEQGQLLRTQLVVSTITEMTIRCSVYSG